MRRLVTGLALLSLGSVPAAAQSASADARLGSRLDARTRAEVMRLIDSAATAGLPAEPLVDKALEGASKRADGSRIVAAVRRLAGELGAVRAALGEGASEGELVAGASALHGGVPADAIARLRGERPDQSLTVPLAVLSELIARGVSPDTAASTVLALTEVRATDAQMVAFRRDVERDIGGGAPPSAATVGRFSSLIANGAFESLGPTNADTRGNSTLTGQRNGGTKQPRRRP